MFKIQRESVETTVTTQGEERLKLSQNAGSIPAQGNVLPDLNSNREDVLKALRFRLALGETKSLVASSSAAY